MKVTKHYYKEVDEEEIRRFFLVYKRIINSYEMITAE
jgi:hypothetical protein